MISSQFRSFKHASVATAGASLLAIGASLCAAPASAQDTASTGEGLEDIIVTARKVSESLQDVPVAVTAFSAEQLEAKGAVRVSDIAAFSGIL